MAYSTARDMEKLACAVLHCKVLTPYVSTWRTVIREERIPAELVNENRLTRTMDGCRELKAAHSPDAGNCVIAAAERNGMVCAVVAFGCPNVDERFAAAKQMLNSAFAGYHISTPGFSEEFLQPMKLRGGTENAVLLELSALPPLALSSGKAPTSVNVLPEYCTVPIRKGQVLGRVCFYQGNTLLTEAQLLAADDVPEMSFKAAWGKVIHFLFRA